MVKVQCKECEKVFSRESALKRHLKTIHGDAVLCEICGEQFKNIKKLLTHQKIAHIEGVTDNKKVLKLENSSNELITCEKCDIELNRRDWKYHLRTNLHKRNSAQVIDDCLKVVKCAFNERIETVVYENNEESLLDPSHFFSVAITKILKALKSSLLKHERFKFNMELFCEYIKMNLDKDNSDDDITSSLKSFNSKMEVINNEEELVPCFKVMTDKIIARMQEFQEKDSGWALIRICYVEVNINQYKPLRGSTYLPLPKFIAQKHACINVSNNDAYCFKWAVISALYPVETHSNRTFSYQVIDISLSTITLKNGIKVEFGELDFPLKLSDICHFESLNPQISINVFGYEEFETNCGRIVGPYFCTRQEKKTHINLLLVQSEELNHYVWIKNISRLVRSQLTSSKNAVFICNMCLSHFHDGAALKVHALECNKIVTIMPQPEKSFLLSLRTLSYSSSHLLIFLQHENSRRSVSQLTGPLIIL